MSIIYKKFQIHKVAYTRPTNCINQIEKCSAQDVQHQSRQETNLNKNPVSCCNIILINKQTMQRDICRPKILKVSTETLHLLSMQYKCISPTCQKFFFVIWYLIRDDLISDIKSCYKNYVADTTITSDLKTQPH